MRSSEWIGTIISFSFLGGMSIDLILGSQQLCSPLNLLKFGISQLCNYVWLFFMFQPILIFIDNKERLMENQDE